VLAAGYLAKELIENTADVLADVAKQRAARHG
jgi:hypothetical protein